METTITFEGVVLQLFKYWNIFFWVSSWWPLTYNLVAELFTENKQYDYSYPFWIDF